MRTRAPTSDPAAAAGGFDGALDALDHLGRPVDCAACSWSALRAEARCQPGRSCAQDRYARRILRFFETNPGAANGALTHAHFEVRAIAARFADAFRLPPLLTDPDETVRWSAARRLPMRHLLALRVDPHREVRIRVAHRLEGQDLAAMMRD
jgi:hypothetical protein